MKSQIYDEIYDKFKVSIILFYICGWLITSLLEIIVGIFFTGGNWYPLYYTIHVIIPTCFDGLIILATLLIVNNKKVKYVVKNYTIIISLVVVGTTLSICHGYYMACLACFIIPVLVSVAFVDKKIFIASMILSLTGLVVSTIVIWFMEHDTVREGNAYIWGSAAIVGLIVSLAASITIVLIKLRESREQILMRAQQENAKLSKQNRVDGLTNLQNHTSFYTVLENKLQKARHDRRGFAIAVLDIDDFKNVNDTYGHATGDEILKHVADVIVAAISSVGVPFRYGGDEFTIIFNNPDPEVNVSALETLRRSIANVDSFFTDGTRVTLSIGYYNIKEATMTAEEIFFKADQALYMAKYNGKNQVYADY